MACGLWPVVCGHVACGHVACGHVLFHAATCTTEATNLYFVEKCFEMSPFLWLPGSLGSHVAIRHTSLIVTARCSSHSTDSHSPLFVTSCLQVVLLLLVSVEVGLRMFALGIDLKVSHLAMFQGIPRSVAYHLSTSLALALPCVIFAHYIARSRVFSLSRRH